MKKFFCLFLSICVLLQPVFAVNGLPKPTASFFVNDFANVINAEDELEIFNMAKNLYENSGNSTQVVVVTIESLDGNSIEEYSNELFNEWEIGSATNDDGVLLLLAVGDRENRIEVGYGLEGVLPDGKTGRIQDDYMLPLFSDDNFSTGLKNGVEAVIGVIDGSWEIKESLDDERLNNDSYGNVYFDIFLSIFSLFLIPLILILSLTRGKVRQCKVCGNRKFKYRRWSDNLYNYIESDCLKCGKKYVKSYRKSDDYYNGSSHHRSSYGGHNSFGSGGRSFHGGGGRSGGGGSSRRF